MDDEIKILRRRLEALEGELERMDQRGGPECAPVALMKTTVVTAYPTSANSYFACNLIRPGGNEVEGAPVTADLDGTGISLVANIGGQIPIVGTYVIAWQIDGHWIMAFNG